MRNMHGIKTLTKWCIQAIDHAINSGDIAHTSNRQLIDTKNNLVTTSSPSFMKGTLVLGFLNDVKGSFVGNVVIG